MTAVMGLGGALIITVAVGLASRARPIGFVVWDEVVGDALYAVAIYLVVATVTTLLRRNLTAPVVGGIAVGVCWAIEASQAAGWTARTVSSASLRNVLGTTFGFTDLIWYVVGDVVIALIDVRWLRPGVASRPATGERRPATGDRVDPELDELREERGSVVAGEGRSRFAICGGIGSTSVVGGSASPGILSRGHFARCPSGPIVTNAPGNT